MDFQFNSVRELLTLCDNHSLPISEIMIEFEINHSSMKREDVIYRVSQSLDVMKNSVKKGLDGVESVTGLTGGDARRLFKYIKEGGRIVSGSPTMHAAAYALAANEFNASMGLICAGPTAGSCGVLPGVLFALRDTLELTRMQMVDFLLTAGAFGLVIANNASISGAAGGCQAEVGSASAMSAAAAVILNGGTNEQAAHACAIALKNLLGLVCDPVAGLVEIPCIKRNVIGAVNALAACDMALSGIESRIPCDEVIIAMGDVGRALPLSLRETALGGLAATPSAKKMEDVILLKKTTV